MKTRAALVVAAVAGSATAVNAQIRAFTDAAHQHPVHIQFTLTTSEFLAAAANGPNFTTAGNANNIIDQNEGAGFKLIATYKSDTGTNLQCGNANAGQTGTTIFFDSTIQAGTTGVGQLSGLWSASFDLNGVPTGGSANGNAGVGVLGGVVCSTAPLPGVSARWGLLPPYAVGAGNGTPVNAGARLNNVQASQFTAAVETMQSSNPTGTIWRGLWVPGSFTGQTVVWTMGNSSVGLPGAEVGIQDNNGSSVPVALTAASDFVGATVVVTNVPGPSSLALLGLGGVVAARRRRR
jgi:hypothetical protein